MVSEKMQEALNDQMNFEMYSGYIYLSMSAYLEDVGLGGHASWMRAQAQEEVLHAMKFFEYIRDRRGRVLMKAIQAPETQWESPLAAFEDAFEHERIVTSRINKLVDLAMEERDHNTNNFLQWFVDEQVEEEASVDDVVQKIKMVGGQGQGLFMLDRELGARVFTPPPATE